MVATPLIGPQMTQNHLLLTTPTPNPARRSKPGSGFAQWSNSDAPSSEVRNRPFGDSMTPLNILHVFRAPVGGLFRHVLDLAHEQIARGHRVGLIADSNTGGARADEVLGELAPSLASASAASRCAATSGPAMHSRWRMSCAGLRKLAQTWCTATARKAAPMPAWRSMPAARSAPTRRTAAACCSATTPWRASSTSRLRKS